MSTGMGTLGPRWCAIALAVSALAGCSKRPFGLTDVEWELLRDAPEDENGLADHISHTAVRFAEGANWGTIALKLGRTIAHSREGLRIAHAITRVADYLPPEVLAPLLAFPDPSIRIWVAQTLTAHAYVEALPQLKEAALTESDAATRRRLTECAGVLETIAGIGR